MFLRRLYKFEETLQFTAKKWNFVVWLLYAACVNKSFIIKDLLYTTVYKNILENEIMFYKEASKRHV
jgi:hypothetical protein